MSELIPTDQEVDQVLALATLDGAKGFENVTADSMKMPFLTVLQSNSPVCMERSRDASIMAGNIYDNVACVGYERVKVIPLMYKQRWIEWIPKDQGGGLVGMHRDFPANAVRAEFGKSHTQDGHDLVDTRIHYVLYLNALGFYEPAIVSMASTAVSKSQIWISQMQANKRRVTQQDMSVSIAVLPMYSRHYELFTVLQKNKLGQQWFNWEVRPLLEFPVPLHAFKQAQSLHQVLQKNDELETESFKQTGAQETQDVPY